MASPADPSNKQDGLLARMALRFTAFAERWFPDAFIFVVIAVVIVATAAVVNGAPVAMVARTFGDGFWSLITFTMQLALLVITGFVVGTSPPVGSAIERISHIPSTSSQAIALIASIAMFLSLFNWAMSLIVGGLLVRALARREQLDLDYRAAGAAAYLGLGATWSFGIGSLSAQLQANVESLPKSLLSIAGVIPFQETVFLWESMMTGAAIFLLALVIAVWSNPSRETTQTAQKLGIDVAPNTDPVARPERPGDWAEYSPFLTIFVVVLGAIWISQEISNTGFIAAASSLNTYNFTFLMAGLLLHWRPRSFLNAVARSVPAVSGVLIQFPFFGAIAAILTQAKNIDGVSVSDQITSTFVMWVSPSMYPIAVAVYSTILGIFIPSGGGRWVVGAPAVMQAANELHVHLGWAVQLFNVVSMPLLINPFFMLPLVGILGLKARDIVGFTFLQFLWHVPVMLFLLWLFTGGLPYTPPVIPEIN